ncbi:MAG: hypothetical protein R3D44_01920 [Hyphomicrobiaceae bacterium]
MSLHFKLRASASLVLGLALFAAAVPFVSGDAEARGRGGKIINAGAAAARAHSHEATDKTAAENPAGHEADSAVDATAPAPAGSAASTSARAQSVTPATVRMSKPKDTDVPGCSPGMMCIVCLAGCNGAVNSIVHEAPKGK